ncbi:MAG: oxidoreductase [Acidimicrobiia bacterium]|nr:oxidoreductase [Acidimicrobiia bacterium]
MAAPWTTADIPDLTGRTALVTGANSGIGLETAAELAGAGARVLLGCRSRERADRAVTEIARRVPSADTDVVELDLADLASVRSAAEHVRREGRLDLLINNAGVMAPPFRETADGFEMQFGVNHLGHFALTGLLIDELTATGGSRVVSVSSNAHRIGRVDFGNLQGEKGYRRARQYGLTKLANLLFIFELQRRLDAAGRPTIAVAAHPGTTDTNLGRDMPKVLQVLQPLFWFGTQSATAGALPTLRAATDPDVRGAEYYGPDGFQEFKGHPVKVDAIGRAHDENDAARLWDVSVALTGVSWDL